MIENTLTWRSWRALKQRHNNEYSPMMELRAARIMGRLRRENQDVDFAFFGGSGSSSWKIVRFL